MSDILHESKKEFKVYKFRWFILAIYCVFQLISATLTFTFAPISDISMHYFDCNITSINMLANISSILYGPGALLAALCMKYFKLRNTLMIGGYLNVLASLLRYIASLNRHSLGSYNTYVIVIIGQCFAGIASPICVNLTSAIASIWFPLNERDITTTIGSMFFPIGGAVGQVLPVLFVTQTESTDAVTQHTNYHVHGMSNLLLAEFVLCAVPALIAYIYVQDEPKTPPSRSTQLKQIKQDSARLLLNGNGDGVSELSVQNKIVQSKEDVWRSFLKESKVLFCDKKFLLLFFSFSVGVAFFNALLTLLFQLIQPYGYSNDDAGTFGAVFIFVGLIGAGIAGYVMEITKAYNMILKLMTFFVFIGFTLLIAMLYRNNFGPLLLSFAVL
eukprot:gene15853-21482_t